MRKIKKALRLIGLIAVLSIAAFGVGVSGHFLPMTDERYRNKAIRTEQVDKKRKEEESPD